VRDPRVFEPKFIFYGLMELYQSGRTEDIQRRTTGIRNLDFAAYKERAKFPKIPLTEQRQIAAMLGSVQRAIQQQEQMLRLTAELKQTLSHDLFSQGLSTEPQKRSDIGLIPESWEVVQLGDVMSEGPKNGLYKHSSAYASGTPILRINDFSNEGDIIISASNRVTTDASENELYGLRKNDVVTNRVNSLSHLGKTALIGELPEPMVFESNMMRFGWMRTEYVLATYSGYLIRRYVKSSLLEALSELWPSRVSTKVT
jgi:type I restriction enzyme S subunit